jgi:hypothetical protein
MTSFKVFYTDPSNGKIWAQDCRTREEADSEKSKFIEAGMLGVVVGIAVQAKMKTREDGLRESIIDKKYTKNLKVGDKFLIDGTTAIFLDKDEEIS